MTTYLQGIVALAARVLLSLIFIFGGVNHLLNWSSTIQFMTSKGMSLESLLGRSGVVFVHIMLAGAVAFLLIGGLSVLLGIRARGGAVLLILFLIPATWIFHDFWNCAAEDPQRLAQMANFMKNTGLGGGLLMVLAFGAGSISLNRFLPKRRAKSTEAEQRVAA
jgi:putative oxidoreductase